VAVNAPTTIASSRRREDYLPTVRHLMPGLDEKETVLRCSLLLIRDNASASMRRCSGEAHPVLLAVEQLASAYAFQRMPIEALEHLRYHLIRLVTSASGLETFASMLGGGDARG
jgi:hypothetical protein